MCGQNQPKQGISAENSVLAETPKREKTETPKPKQAEIFGRNRTETVSVCPLHSMHLKRCVKYRGPHENNYLHSSTNATRPTPQWLDASSPLCRVRTPGTSQSILPYSVTTGKTDNSLSDGRRTPDGRVRLRPETNQMAP